MPSNSSHTHDLSFTSKCLSHNFRLPPDSTSKNTTEEHVTGRSDSSRPQTDSESKKHVQPAACGGLLSKHRLKQTDEILPRHTAHAVASCLLLTDETVILSDITYKLILSWKQIGDSMDACSVFKSCGFVSMSAETLMKQDMYLPLQPGWPTTGNNLVFIVIDCMCHTCLKCLKMFNGIVYRIFDSKRPRCSSK